jgi:hypothetical protein
VSVLVGTAEDNANLLADGAPVLVEVQRPAVTKVTAGSAEGAVTT